MKHTVLKYVAKDGKAHGGRDHLDSRTAASLAGRGQAADHVGGTGSGCRGRGSGRPQWGVSVAALHLVDGWRGTTGCLASRSRPSPPLRSFRFASGRPQRRHRASVRLHLRRRTPVLRSPRAVARARSRSFSATAARSKSTRALIRRRSPGSSTRWTEVARDHRANRRAHLSRVRRQP